MAASPPAGFRQNEGGHAIPGRNCNRVLQTLPTLPGVLSNLGRARPWPRTFADGFPRVSEHSKADPVGSLSQDLHQRSGVTICEPRTHVFNLAALIGCPDLEVLDCESHSFATV